MSTKTTNNLEKLSDLYYTATEARKKLGMTRDAFNHYVKTGAIQKVKIVGKHGHYAKRDIDALAMNIAAAMLAAQAPDITFKQATLEDQENEFELAVLNFGEQTKRFNVYRRELLLANPEMSYYVYDRERLVASINITPLKHNGILKFKDGERGWLLGEYVERFEPSKELEVIIIDFMTTPLAPANRRTQYAMHLFFGLGRLLEEWGKHGIIIKSIHACGGTPQGRHLLETAGFTKIGEFGARHIYEVNVEDSNLKLLSSYKENIAQYKASKHSEEK
jgi:hypothetical protein